MSALSEAIESREIEVQCRCCGWSELRTLNWLGARRDMHCPACLSVIVLNTSERRREISHLRRQMAALHEHFADVISERNHFTSAARMPVRAAPSAPNLALVDAYRGNLSGRSGEARSRRGNPPGSSRRS